MPKKVIIFDMDGVLFDTIPNGRKFFLERHPGVSNEMYNEIHAGNFHTESAKYNHLKIHETEEEAERFKKLFSEAKLAAPLFDGVKDLLEDLHKKGNLLVLNTNAYNRNCLPLLKKAQIDFLFDFIADAEVSKDKVEKFKLIEQKYCLAKTEFLFVTDALGDVKDADVAGVPTIAVTWGVHDKTFFHRKKYNHLVAIVDTVDSLSNFIKQY